MDNQKMPDISKIENQDAFGRVVMRENLSDIRAAGSDLSGWRLWSSSIKTLNLIDCRFNSCWADECRLKDVTFDLCLCRYAFIGTTWRECLFQKESYHFVRFPGAVFVRTRFVNPVFDGTDIHEAANLEGVEGLKL